MSLSQYKAGNIGALFKENDPESLVRTISTDLPANMGFFTLDSRDRQGGENVNSFNLNKKDSLFQLSNVEKLFLEFVVFDAQGLPNVNDRNNKIIVDDNLGMRFTGEIKDNGYYNDEAFVTALNATFSGFAGFAGGVPTVTLTSDIDGRKIHINAVGGFTPIKDNSVNRDLWALAGLKESDYRVLVNSQINCSELFYTYYIDIRSRALSQFDELLDESSNPTSADLVQRIYLNTGIPVYNVPVGESFQGYYRPSTIAFKTDQPRWIAWNQHSSNFGNVIDFELTDQFGEKIPDDNCVEFSLIFYTRTYK